MFNPCFIFLTYENQSNPDLWASYKDCPRFFYRKNTNSQLDPFLQTAIEVEYPFKTHWGGITIADCMIHCLAEAYHNTNCSHFIFASGACVPVFDYTSLLSEFANQEKGIVSNHLFRKFKNEKYSQWSLIPRNFAKILIESERIDVLDGIVNYHKNSFKNYYTLGAPDEFYIKSFCKDRNINVLDYFEIGKISYHTWTSNKYHAEKIDKSDFLKIRERLKRNRYILCRKILDK